MYESHFHFQDKHERKGILFPVAVRDSGACCHGPIVNSACVVIPAKQGCGGLIHGVSERHGLDALGCILAMQSGVFPHTWKQTHFPRTFKFHFC